MQRAELIKALRQRAEKDRAQPLPHEGCGALLTLAADALDQDAAPRDPVKAFIDGKPWTVGSLGRYLLSLSDEQQDRSVRAVFFADYDGKREAFARALSISWERVVGTRIQSGDPSIPRAMVFWSARDERPEAADEIEPISAVPAGWKLVPVEPTVEMIGAFHGAVEASIFDEPLGFYQNGYAALIAAAPVPPSPWMEIDENTPRDGR